MKLTITNTDNAAFGEDDQSRAMEIARILVEVSAEIRNGEECGTLRDYNGNKVGTWTL